mgnify:FL=1
MVSMASSEPMILSLSKLEISHILSFLPSQDIMLAFKFTCKKFKTTVEQTQLILLRCLYNMTCFSDSLGKILRSRDLNSLLRIIQTLFAFQVDPAHLLPVYAFETDGGIHNFDHKFSFHRIFSKYKPEKYQAYSSCTVPQAHVQGTLAIQFYEECLHPYRLNVLLKQLEGYEQFQTQLRCRRQSKIGHSTSPARVLSDYQTEAFLYPLKIEFDYQPLGNSFAILTEIEIAKPMHFDSPVSTLMLFVSDSKINFEDASLRVFDNIKSSSDLLNLYKNNIGNSSFPKIHSSNIEEFRTIQYLSDSNGKEADNGTVEEVIFWNRCSKPSESVKPVFWIKLGQDVQKIRIKLPIDNLFSGQYFVAKLIDTEGSPSQPVTMDIDFVTLKGYVIGEFEGNGEKKGLLDGLDL